MEAKSQSESNTKSSSINDEPKKGILLGYIFDFVKQNILWVITTIVILFITNPLEIIVLSNLFPVLHYHHLLLML